MLNKTKGSLDHKIVQLIKENMPNGLGFNDLFDMMKGKKGEAGYGKAIGSRSTLSKSLRWLRKAGFIQQDSDSRRNITTADGQKYLERSEIVDFILSSTALDSLFDWNAEKEQERAEEISAVYMLVNAKKDAPHALAMLHYRGHRSQPLVWDADVLKYISLGANLLSEKDIKKALEGTASLEELALLQKRIRAVWKKLFNGVERLTVVETVSPQLLLEKIEKKLIRSSGLLVLKEKERLDIKGA